MYNTFFILLSKFIEPSFS